MRYGDYTFDGNVLVMHIKRFIFGKNDHYHHIADNPYRTLRASWRGKVLSLDGDFGEAGNHNHIQLMPTRFNDMNFVLPYSNE